MGTRRQQRSSFVGDRFIPVRAAMDFDFAYTQLTTGGSVSARPVTKYQELLAQTVFGNNNRRILRFNNNPQPSQSTVGDGNGGSMKIRKTLTSDRVLYAGGLVDYDTLNLLDWGSRNVVALGIENGSYLWNPSDGSSVELVTVSQYVGPVTSVSWAPDGRHLAIGFTNSEVELWDATYKRRVRTFGGLQGYIGALAWNNDILTTGGADGKIVNFDMRMKTQVATYHGHSDVICGLKWCESGRRLASGGKDNLVHIWDVKMASRPRSHNDKTQWLHRLSDHRGGVRALAWCPSETDILASGGGAPDGCIRFWQTSTGTCINSVQVDSQVCSLLWSRTKMQFLSSSGVNGDQVVLRNYSSMIETATLSGHAGRVLYTAQSPDGCSVATASGIDRTVRLWKDVFTPAPESSKDSRFSQFANCHIR